MSKEFEYHQRPFSSKVTDADYDLATGRIKIPTIEEAITQARADCRLAGLPEPESLRSYQVPRIHPAGQPCDICGVTAEHTHVGGTL